MLERCTLRVSPRIKSTLTVVVRIIHFHLGLDFGFRLGLGGSCLFRRRLDIFVRHIRADDQIWITPAIHLLRLTGEALARAFGFAAAFGLVGWKSSDWSDSSPAARFFFLIAALIAALPLGLPDLAASTSSCSAS